MVGKENYLEIYQVEVGNPVDDHALSQGLTLIHSVPKVRKLKQ